VNPRKLALARAFEICGLNRALLRLQRLGGPYLRALNYHDVPREAAPRFEAQLAYFARHFEPVGLAELQAFLAGRSRPRRPGLLLTFDDGLRSHADVVAPLLERYGFPGWFAVPAEFPDLRVADHAEFMDQRRVSYRPDDYPDGRGLLDWDDLRRLDGRHVVCCHGFTHRRLEENLGEQDLALEIRRAKARLEEGLGHEVPVFVWVGGEEWAYSAAAARAMREAGFRITLMSSSARIRPGDDPFHLQRTNVEADYPESLLRFSLSGAFDLLYLPRRRRIDRLTAAPPGPRAAGGG
jgi:peptidoglycan/xylan/chitin deacetylase (PgdA/CDA1 family)